MTSREGPHNCTHASILLHLTPHSAGGPHIATLVQDHTAGLVRLTKDLIRPHSRLDRDLMGTRRYWHLKPLQNRKASQLLSENCGSLRILLFFFSPANDRRDWWWWEKCKERAKNTLKILFSFPFGSVVCVWVPRCLSFRMDGQIND